MFKARRFFCALLALALLAGMVSVAAAEPETAPSATVYTHDGRVTLIDGACTDAPVRGFGDAAAVVDSVLDQLGGDENTLLEPWRELTDAYGNRYYVFQQMFDNTTVLGGAVKVITDDGGSMIGLTSSIVANPAEPDAGEDISAGEAEQIVLEHAAQTRQPALAPVEGLTRRMILPKTLAIDIEAEDDEGSRYVWVVYTNNPDGSQTHSSDLPYLAHYVTMDGEYLYSLPTIIPGDEAGASGFDASYVFEFMESVNYTGYVDLSGGEELEISVDVMRDKRTGMYYLGNLERRIVVADCWEFLYNGNRVVLESSPDNLEWDQVGLLTLYNYCRAGLRGRLPGLADLPGQPGQRLLPVPGHPGPRVHPLRHRLGDDLQRLPERLWRHQRGRERHPGQDLPDDDGRRGERQLDPGRRERAAGAQHERPPPVQPAGVHLGHLLQAPRQHPHAAERPGRRAQQFFAAEQRGLAAVREGRHDPGGGARVLVHRGLRHGARHGLRAAGGAAALGAAGVRP